MVGALTKTSVLLETLQMCTCGIMFSIFVKSRIT
uniref:Uncharacterized protein n=1 Tax=Anguilla anguilla TaxID=7936 RepID=A0A0E9QF42_ANGAN